MLHHSTRQNAVHSYLCCLPTGVQWNSQDLTTVRVRVVNTALQGLCGAGIPKNISDGWHVGYKGNPSAGAQCVLLLRHFVQKTSKLIPFEPYPQTSLHL